MSKDFSIGLIIGVFSTIVTLSVIAGLLKFFGV